MGPVARAGDRSEGQWREGLRVGQAGPRWRSTCTCAGDLSLLPGAVAHVLHHVAERPLRPSAQDGGRQRQRGVRGLAGVPRAWTKWQLQGRQGGLDARPGPAAAQRAAHGLGGIAVPERPARGLPGLLDPDLHRPTAVAASVHQADPESLSCKVPDRS